MTRKMKRLTPGEWLQKHASHCLGNGITTFWVLGLWYDHALCDAEIEAVVELVQIGPGFKLDGLDRERRILQLSSIAGFKDADEANAYFDDWNEELFARPLREFGVSGYELAWTHNEHPEMAGRSSLQLIDKRFLNDPYGFKEIEAHRGIVQ